MILDNLIKPFAYIAYLITNAKEKRLNFSLKFANQSGMWLPSKIVYEMDDVWKKEGLDAIGTNYFTIGAIKNGISQRFDPDSNLYQSWLGGYIVKFNKKREWTINDHYRLAVADQKNWLDIYGDPRPFVQIVEKSIIDHGEINISGFKGNLYEGHIESHSDVGNKELSLYRKLFLSGLVYYFNQDNPNLNLNSKNITPLLNDKFTMDSYQKILLKGYIAIFDLDENVKAVLYVNGADYIDTKSKSHHNFDEIKEEILVALKNIEIQREK